MAKLIGRGPDRASAVGVLREALDGLEVEGVETQPGAAARRARARGLRDRRGHDPLARGGGARVTAPRRSRSSTRRRATATSRCGARPASRRPTSSRSRRPSTASASARATSPRARTWPSPCASTARTRGSACGSSAAAMPHTPLSMITTGKRFISWRPCAEDVVALVFRTAGAQRPAPRADRRPDERPGRPRADGARSRRTRASRRS